MDRIREAAAAVSKTATGEVRRMTALSIRVTNSAASTSPTIMATMADASMNISRRR
jgi:hypothetical protein